MSVEAQPLAWDDNVWITNNVVARSKTPLLSIFRVHDDAWYPATQLAIWGAGHLSVVLGAELHQLIRGLNVVLTSCSFVLLSCALVRLGASPQASAVVSFAFWLHPLRMEQVLWASGLRDSLATTLLLGSLLLFLRRSGAWVLLSTAAGLAKAPLALVPFAFGFLPPPAA